MVSISVTKALTGLSYGKDNRMIPRFLSAE